MSRICFREAKVKCVLVEVAFVFFSLGEFI